MRKYRSFLERAKSIRLSKSEKDEIRANLHALMAREPISGHVRDVSLVNHVTQWSKQAISMVFSLIKQHGMPVVIVLLITLIAGGGVSYASESALPGTVLYPVKIHINEGVQSVFMVSSERRGAWEAELLNRRLQEAELLAYNNRFTGSAKTEVESLIRLQSQKLRKLAQVLLDRGEVNIASVVSTNLEIPLRVHEVLLQRLAVTAPENQDEDIQSLATALSVEKREVEKVRADLESKEHVLLGGNRVAAVQGKLVSSANTLRRVQNAFSKTENTLGDGTISDVKAKLSLADGLRSEGAEALEDNDLERAYESFQGAIRLGREAQLLVESEKKLRAYAGVAVFDVPEELGQASSTTDVVR